MKKRSEGAENRAQRPIGRLSGPRCDAIKTRQQRASELKFPSRSSISATHPGLSTRVLARGALILMAAGDFDNDGDVDLAFSFEEEGRISFILNEGGRKFSPGPHFPTGGRALFGSAKDVDGDGQLDLMIANGATDDVVVLFGLRDYLQSGGAVRPDAPDAGPGGAAGGQEGLK
jgi:hypothetical protein